jgi:hypothetical protein
MKAMCSFRVSIQRTALTGTVVYEEGLNRAEMYLERGGGNALWIVSGPPPQDWDGELPWAAGRRRIVMTRAAAAVIEQLAPGCHPVLGDGDCTVAIVSTAKGER